LTEAFFADYTTATNDREVRMPRFLSDSRPSSAQKASVVTNFYREEFVKHQQCLHQQREYYSERAITSVEAALSRILANLDRICQNGNAPELVSQWLQKFDSVTGLSAWSDTRNVH
jgi:hypothetical protein